MYYKNKFRKAKISLPTKILLHNTLCFEDSTSSKAGTLTYEHQGNKTFIYAYNESFQETCIHRNSVWFTKQLTRVKNF